MKIVVWLLCLVVATLWTGFAFFAAESMQWIANGLAAGQISDPTVLAAQWPVPAWIDPVWQDLAQSMLASALSLMGDVMPFVSSAMSWVAPLIWAIWGMGILVLLALAGTVHFLMRFFQHPRRSPAVSATTL